MVGRRDISKDTPFPLALIPLNRLYSGHISRGITEDLLLPILLRELASRHSFLNSSMAVWIYPFRYYMYIYVLPFNLIFRILFSLCPSLLFLFHSNLSTLSLSNLSKGRPCKLPLLLCRCAFLLVTLILPNGKQYGLNFMF